MADLPEMDPLRRAEQERRRRIMKETELLKEGVSIYDSWVNLSLQKPPDNILGRILWSAGVLGQISLSISTFPAALGAFLLEEAVQTFGMGAYMLSSAKEYETLDLYIESWKYFLGRAHLAARNLAAASPVTGGAVLMYMEAAEYSLLAFEAANDANLLKQAETDEALRKKLLDRAQYASLRIQSSPNNAEIWMNGENTNLLTPETFKQLDAGPYTFLLRKYSTVRDIMETFEFDITLEAGYKKEVFVRIPKYSGDPPTPPPEATTGVLRILSTPTNAEIYLNSVNTEALTPETFKEITPGRHEIKLRAFSRTLDVWDEYTFNVEITADEKLEIKVNIPGAAFDVIKTRLEVDETEEPQLGEFVKAEVTGDHAIDGDTFVTTTGERIRILAIDAPELGRPWGEDSREGLGILIEDKKIQLRIQSHKPLDQYGRTLAIASSWKGDVAVFQLSAGYARLNIFPDDIYDPAKYVAAEQIAHDRKIGIWS